MNNGDVMPLCSAVRMVINANFISSVLVCATHEAQVGLLITFPK